MPISDKQLAANRASAAKSTGPRTPEGKARSSANSCAHGFTASTFAVVRLEELDEIANLKRDLVSFYQPTNSQEPVCPRAQTSFPTLRPWPSRSSPCSAPPASSPASSLPRDGSQRLRHTHRTHAPGPRRRWRLRIHPRPEPQLRLSRRFPSHGQTAQRLGAFPALPSFQCQTPLTAVRVLKGFEPPQGASDRNTKRTHAGYPTRRNQTHFLAPRRDPFRVPDQSHVPVEPAAGCQLVGRPRRSRALRKTRAIVYHREAMRRGIH